MLKSVAWVSVGTVATQLVSLVSTPILTRMYGPSEYGVFATFITATTLLTLLATWRLELAIDLPKERAESRRLASLCLLLALATCVVVLMLGGLGLLLLQPVRDWVDRSLVYPQLLFLIPVMALLGVWGNLIAAYHFRNLDFKQVTIRRVSNALIDVGAKLGFGSMGGFVINGLVAGTIVSSSTFVAQVKTIALKGEQRLFEPLRWTQIRALLTEFRQFPIFGLPTVLTNQFYTSLPIWVVGSYFGTTTLGLVYIAQRLAQIPEQALSVPVAQVFRRHAAQRYRETGECRDLFLKTAVSLLAGGLLLMLPMFLFAEDILRWLFGARWETAAPAARILIVAGFLQFVASPLTTMFVVAARQRSDFLLSSVVLIAGCAAAWLSLQVFGTLEALLSAVVLVHALKYSVECFLSYRMACGR
jgi:O-antigen/teichoic acid export membrane protein